MKERESEMAIETDENTSKIAEGSIDEISRKVQDEEPVQAPDNGYMPDPSMSVEAMNAYGYTDSDTSASVVSVCGRST